MSCIEKIKSEISKLSAEELASLRNWFLEFDASAWDQRFEADVKAGKLDGLADRAPVRARCRQIQETLTHHASPVQ